jgi:hypothetical protein
MPDISVPHRLPPGVAVTDLQDIETLSQQNLVQLLCVRSGFAADGCSRDGDLHPAGALEPPGVQAALEVVGGEVRPGEGEAGVGLHA